MTLYHNQSLDPLQTVSKNMKAQRPPYLRSKEGFRDLTSGGAEEVLSLHHIGVLQSYFHALYLTSIHCCCLLVCQVHV